MEDIHHLVEKCYNTDNILSLASQDTPSRELRDFLARSALLFKNLGDHLFLANVTLGANPILTSIPEREGTAVAGKDCLSVGQETFRLFPDCGKCPEKGDLQITGF